eukprot:gene4035-4413_t
MASVPPTIVESKNSFIPLQNIDPHSFPLDSAQFVDFDNFVTLQQAAAAAYPDKPLFGVYQPNNTFKYITYKDFNVLVDYTRGVLEMLGVGPNDKVAIISNNRVEWAAALYATLGRGGQVVPMYEAQKEKEWRYIIEDSGAKVVFAATEKIYESVKEYINEVGNVKAAVCLDASVDKPHSFESWLQRAKGAAAAKGKGQEGSFFPARVPSKNDLAAIIYTSGTTGNPKGVLLTQGSLSNNIRVCTEIHQFTDVRPYINLREVYANQIAANPSNDPNKKFVVDLLSHNVSLCFLPWSHVYGMTAELSYSMASGSALALVPHRDLILQCLQVVKPTIIFSVPMLFNRVYDGVQKTVTTLSPLKQKIFRAAFAVARERNDALEHGRPVSSWLEWKFLLADRVVLKGIREKLGGKLRYMTNGGAKLDPLVMRFFEDIGIPITDGYGLTETSPVVSLSGMDRFKRRYGTTGVVLPGSDVRIVDPESLQDVGDEHDGEIVVHGPHVMQGYHNNKKATAEAFFARHVESGKVLSYESYLKLPASEQGPGGYKLYFRTGDQGRLIEQKFLKITGRIKEQYKLLNGKYVVPSPVEDVLNRFQGMQQCFLYGNNQQYNILLVVPNYAEIKNFLGSLNITGRYNDLLQALDKVIEAVKVNDMEAVERDAKVIIESADVIKYLSDGIVRQSRSIKSFERPMRWAPIPCPFSVENQMLTPKMSMRRNNVKKAYEALINDLYGDLKLVGYRLDHGASASIDD